jgi:hypothetical protein
MSKHPNQFNLLFMVLQLQQYFIGTVICSNLKVFTPLQSLELRMLLMFAPKA